MARLRLTLVVLLVVGSLVAIPAAAQTTRASGFDELGIAITINKLKLTTSQMQQVHEILAGILSEASALKQSRQAFTEEMVQFTGDSAELEAALSGFRSETMVQAEELRETVRQALDDLKGILTIEQGEVLRSALMQADGMRLMFRQPDAFARQRNRGLDVTDRDKAVPQMQDMRIGTQEMAQALPEWLEQMKTNHPEAAKRIVQRWADRNRDKDDQSPSDISTGLRSLHDTITLLGSGKGERLLEVLEQIVDILGEKLSYLQ